MLAGLGAPRQGGGASCPGAPSWASWFGEAGPCVQAGPVAGWWGKPDALLLGEWGQAWRCSNSAGGCIPLSPLWRAGR